MRARLHPRFRPVGLFALSLLLLTAGMVAAQPPAGYYDSVDTTNASALRATLHDVIDDHTRFPYTDSTTDTWDILNLADEDPNNVGNIIDIYKNASYGKIPGGVGAYNREHSWPRSYGFPNDGADNYPYTDCHHLFASDAGYNSSRSNKPFRNCDAGCSEQPTDFNDGRGGGTGVYPGNSNWTSGSFTQGTWEAWDGRKGDVARAILYMDVRYEGGVHSGTGFSEPDLIVTDSESLIDSGNTGSNESVAYMGMLSVLLQWHAQDPPDSRELWRNEVVFSFQGNRNPFIDHPEWVACLYAGSCVLDTTPPAAPLSLMATAGNGSVSLSWLANGESDLAGYHVYRATSASGPFGRVNGALVGVNSFTDSAVTNGTVYFYRVTAVDTSSNESADSNQVSATPDSSIPDTTAPAAPTGLGATSGDAQVQLSWSANSESDLAGYHIYRATSASGPFSRVNGSLVTATSFLDSGLTNGTTYYHLITAVDLSGNESADSPTVSATPLAPGAGGVILSEVLYDVSSGDDSFEWVELFHSGSGTVDLSSYCLGNGGTAYTTSLVQLSGSIASGATFVVGGPTSSSTNANPVFDQVFNFNPDFQNSGSTGDGVALFDVPCAQVDGASVPIDAVIYGPNNNSGLIDETGSANAPEVGDASPGSSIQRLDPAGNWQIQSSPTPNATSLAPPTGNQAPSVTVTSPQSGGSTVEGSTVNFAGSASDPEDGGLTSSLTWTSSLDGALGTGGSFSAVLSVGTHTITAAVVDSGGLPGSDTISLTVTAVQPGNGDLLLSEVFYDPSGNDDGLEWVELYNNDSVAIDLAGYSLGNGGTAYTTSLVQLSGIIQPGETFVVGGPTSSAINDNPNLGQAVNFSPDFQNSGSTGDGVALFNVPASAVTASTVPIDAVIYGPNNNSGLIDETGAAGAPEVGDAPSDSSIERLDLAGNWQIQSNPTPNATPIAAPNPTTLTFTSVAAEDGWVRESSENSNVGGRNNSTGAGANAVRAGDQSNGRQYKGVISFDTSAIPDGATITSATLRLRRGRVVGTNPFSTHGTCWVDVHSGGLGGSTALANGDFQAVASVARSASLSNAASNGDWSEASLDAVGLTAVDATGTTQLRFYFDLDDNDDGGTDTIGYYPGNHSNTANHPQLVVTYQ
ncbi:MAG: endonuclease [Acidobacteriota bacterium]